MEDVVEVEADERERRTIKTFLALGHESRHMPLAVICCLGAGTGQSHLCIASCSSDVFVCE